jgi:hypothetical protein
MLNLNPATFVSTEHKNVQKEETVRHIISSTINLGEYIYQFYILQGTSSDLFTCPHTIPFHVACPLKSKNKLTNSMEQSPS